MTQMLLPLTEQQPDHPSAGARAPETVTRARRPKRAAGSAMRCTSRNAGATRAPSSVTTMPSQAAFAFDIPVASAESDMPNVTHDEVHDGNDDEEPLPLTEEERPATLDDALVLLRQSGRFDPRRLKRLTSDVRMATKLASILGRPGATAATGVGVDPVWS
jgi:hypothetical protein